jgi:hypothetical protein
VPFQLDVRHENLSYVGRFASPPFKLWGAGGIIVKHLLEALAPHGVSLQNFKAPGSNPTVADPVITIDIPNVGYAKFGFDKIEFNITNFTSDFLRAFPVILHNCTSWIGEFESDFRLSSHYFSYFTHAFVKDATAETILKSVNPKGLKSGGISVGNGAIFNYSIPEKSWETQLTVDRSRYLNGAVFVNLSITISDGTPNYDKILSEGRIYLRNVLSDLELFIPELNEG